MWTAILLFFGIPVSAYTASFAEGRSVFLLAMLHHIYLFLTLATSWLLWSGHFDNYFILALGLLSVLLCLWVCRRMRIVDEETIPVLLAIRGLLTYVPYLIREIVVSNLEVTKIILSRKMPLQRNMIEVEAGQKTELGKVIFANSITLTPGTVSVSTQKDRILVHALSFAGAEEDLSGDMDRRVRKLENKPKNPVSDSIQQETKN
ncbi:MAG: Na+/H+ antiporter subunit E [Planctomycetota bacterium]